MHPSLPAQAWATAAPAPPVHDAAEREWVWGGPHVDPRGAAVALLPPPVARALAALGRGEDTPRGLALCVPVLMPLPAQQQQQHAQHPFSVAEAVAAAARGASLAVVLMAPQPQQQQQQQVQAHPPGQAAVAAAPARPPALRELARFRCPLADVIRAAPQQQQQLQQQQAMYGGAPLTAPSVREAHWQPLEQQQRAGAAAAAGGGATPHHSVVGSIKAGLSALGDALHITHHSHGGGSGASPSPTPTPSPTPGGAHPAGPSGSSSSIHAGDVCVELTWVPCSAQEWAEATAHAADAAAAKAQLQQQQQQYQQQQQQYQQQQYRGAPSPPTPAWPALPPYPTTTAAAASYPPPAPPALTGWEEFEAPPPQRPQAAAAPLPPPLRTHTIAAPPLASPDGLTALAALHEVLAGHRRAAATAAAASASFATPAYGYGSVAQAAPPPSLGAAFASHAAAPGGHGCDPHGTGYSEARVALRVLQVGGEGGGWWEGREGAPGGREGGG